MEPLFTRRFVTLWLFQFGTFFSAFQLLPVIPLRIVELGGSKAEAGLFLAVYTFASAFAAPITGTIADHVGRRRMLVLASIAFVVFSIAYAVVTWLPIVLLIGVIHGAIWSGILSAAGAIMTDFIPPGRRTEGLAWWGIAPTAAISIAPAAGLFAYRFGWWVLCVEIATLSVIAAVWATRIPGGTTAAPHATLPRLAELYDWQVVRMTLSLSVVAFGYGGITSYVAILARERSIRPESVFFSAFALTVVAVRVLTSRLGDRFGPKVLLYPALVAIPISFAVLASAQTRGEMIASAILFGIGMGASFPAFMTIIVGATDESRRARTFGSVIWAFDAGIGLGSIVLGAIGERAGLTFAFRVAAAISCFAIPIFLATSRRLDRGTAVADTATHG
jgi:MFS family permease